MEYIQIGTSGFDEKPAQVASYATMTVQELINVLSKYDPNIPVIIRNDDGKSGVVRAHLITKYIDGRNVEN